MRQFFMFTWVATKILFRSREAVFWNFLFPVALFILYVTVFSGVYPSEIPESRTVADNFSKILTITIMSGGLFSLAISVSVMKEKGILRRYKVTPVRPITIVSGIVVRQYFFMLLVTAVLFLMAIIPYNADFGGGVLELFIIASLGILVFSSLGFCIAGIMKTNQGTIGAANLLFMPMLFLSGAAIPVFLFPKWLKDIASVFPATHLLNILQRTLFEGKALAQDLKSLLILIGFGIVFLIVAAFVSRWN
ncbi:MAG TPA: ABC transporter permease [candidate division Zixibacteria bacterium]|nr:ABC transporter permease [candidate division Zixibacteria bacterium]HEQ99307.1 ABC transporter permease [candidate division Zixibacteria bacterium]